MPGESTPIKADELIMAAHTDEANVCRRMCLNLNESGSLKVSTARREQGLFRLALMAH